MSGPGQPVAQVVKQEVRRSMNAEASGGRRCPAGFPIRWLDSNAFPLIFRQVKAKSSDIEVIEVAEIRNAPDATTRCLAVKDLTIATELAVARERDLSNDGWDQGRKGLEQELAKWHQECRRISNAIFWCGFYRHKAFKELHSRCSLCEKKADEMHMQGLDRYIQKITERVL